MTDTAAHTVAITRRAATKDRRSIEQRYAITSLEQYSERERGLITPALTVSVQHWGERKAFLLTVDRVLITPFGFRTVITYGSNRNEQVRALNRAVRTERYSARVMESVFEGLLAEVEPQLPDLLEWAAGAIRENEGA